MSGHTAGSPPVACVVVPAHNEAAVIGRLLDALQSGIAPGQIEVIVACNGCTDGTADIARARGATVVEIEAASKIAALNAGDDAATGFPRCYVDADVVVTGGAVAEVARLLSEPGVLCAAPPFRLDLAGRPWSVRAFCTVWLRDPYFSDGYVGSGFYAMSEEGRKRFARFPEIIADDLLARNLFSLAERRVAAAEPFVVQAPWTLRALFRRRVRIYAGNMELSDHPEYRTLPGSRGQSASWWRGLLTKPRLVPSVCLYLAVNLLAKFVARRQLRRRRGIDWGRDDTTRSVPTG